MDKTVVKLQEEVFHQGEEILSLSSELYNQQKEISELKIQILKLEAKLKHALEGSNIRKADEETPPPHY